MRLIAILAMILPLSGCIVSTAVGLAADVVETAVTVPIEAGAAVGGAALGAMSRDKDKKGDKKADEPSATAPDSRSAESPAQP